MLDLVRAGVVQCYLCQTRSGLSRELGNFHTPLLRGQLHSWLFVNPLYLGSGKGYSAPPARWNESVFVGVLTNLMWNINSKYRHGEKMCKLEPVISDPPFS